MKLFSLVIFLLVLVSCSSEPGTPDIDRTAEFEAQLVIDRVAAQLTAQAPTPTASPTLPPRPTRAPFATSSPTAPPTPTPNPTPTRTPRPTPTPTPTPRPTPTPIPRLLGVQYRAADGVRVTVNSFSVTTVENSTTVSISYTLTNTTAVLKEEKLWKLFFQGPGDQIFGVGGNLLPKQSIDRNFTFGVVAPNGLLMLAYPSELSDITWDQDDLTWNMNDLLAN